MSRRCDDGTSDDVKGRKLDKHQDSILEAPFCPQSIANHSYKGCLL